jgi:hypothetical protein
MLAQCLCCFADRAGYIFDDDAANAVAHKSDGIFLLLDVSSPHGMNLGSDL